MKIGLDIHGVIDSNPQFFSRLTHSLMDYGHEVHILTGPKRESVESFLQQHDIVFTHFFSIVDEAEKNAKKIRWEDSNNPWIDDESWNKAKAIYCMRHNIDIHMDDSDIYGQYFKTPYARYYANRSPRLVYISGIT